MPKPLPAALDDEPPPPHFDPVLILRNIGILWALGELPTLRRPLTVREFASTTGIPERTVRHARARTLPILAALAPHATDEEAATDRDERLDHNARRRRRPPRR
jgi:hypothetical protein